MASSVYTVRFAEEVVAFPEHDGGNGSRFSATLNDATFAEESIRQIFSNLGARTFVPAAPGFRHLPDRNVDRWGNTVELIDMTDDYVVTFARELAAEELATLRELDEVRFIGPQPSGEFFFTPNDPYFDDQWALENSGQTLDFLRCNPDSTATADHDSDATAAWDDVLEPGCLIGVLDSGVRSSHDDLLGSLHALSATTDDCGHGTALCGVIAAAGDNGIGIAGIARPDKDESSESLVVYPILDAAPQCGWLSESVTTGLSFFANDSTYAGIGVVNESFGHYESDKWAYDPVLRDAHRNAYVKGLLLVAAAGNENCALSADSCYAYPAAFNYFVTAVSGLDADGNNPFPAFTFTDLVAGSDNIVTTWDTGDEDYLGYDATTQCGTSLAAPLVTGAAAMLLGANGGLTNDDLRAVLLRTAEDLDEEEGRSDEYGHGQLQLADAIAFVSSPNKVYHGTTTSFSATYLGAMREQEFANTPFNTQPDDFESFLVRPYELEITASFAAKGIGETVIDAWGRPRVSQGFPNDAKIDAHLLTSYLETNLESMTASSVDLYTYTYKVFAAVEGDTTCLGWYPIEVPGEGSCGSSANLAKFDYTFVTEPSSRTSGPVVSTPGLTVIVSRRAEEIQVRADRIAGADAITYELLDVTGRALARETVLGDGPVVFPTVDLPSGVYFAVARSGSRTGSAKVTIVR